MHRRVQQKERRRDNQKHFGDTSVILESTKTMLQEIVVDVRRWLNVVALEQTIVLA